MLDVPALGKTWIGRQKTRWKDSCNGDMESVGLKKEDARDGTKWKDDLQKHSGDPR